MVSMHRFVHPRAPVIVAFMACVALAACARSGIRPWEPERIALRQKSVCSLAWSSDGTRLASGHTALNPRTAQLHIRPLAAQVRLWRAASQLERPRENHATFELPVEWGQPELGFTPDSDLVVAATAGGYATWNIEQQRLEPHETAGPASISADSRWLAVDRGNGLVQLLEVMDRETGQKRAALQAARSSFSYNLLSPHGKLLAAFPDATPDGEDSTVVVWNVAEERVLCRVTVENCPGPSRFSLDEELLAFVSDEELHLWNVASDEKVTSWPVGDGVWCLSFSPNGRWLAVACEGDVPGDVTSQGQIIIFDLLDRARCTTIVDRSTSAITALAFSPDGLTLACGDLDGRITFRDLSVSVSPH